MRDPAPYTNTIITQSQPHNKVSPHPSSLTDTKITAHKQIPAKSSCFCAREVIVFNFSNIFLFKASFGL